MTADDQIRFLKQFELSREEVREMKRHTPHIFHEWQRLKAAEKTLEQATAALAAAQKAWDAL